MMANSLIFAIAFSVLMCNNISLVQCYDECNTYADCHYPRPRSCCGIYDYYTRKLQRHCMYGFASCLYFSCASDSDCRDLSMCCRSGICVSKGCAGCTNNIDCDTGLYHVCGKKTFPFYQTVCAAKLCGAKFVTSNDDCARYEESVVDRGGVLVLILDNVTTNVSQIPNVIQINIVARRRPHVGRETLVVLEAVLA